jgi:hypothetical protein
LDRKPIGGLKFLFLGGLMYSAFSLNPQHCMPSIAMPEVIDVAFSAENLFGPALARELYELLGKKVL